MTENRFDFITHRLPSPVHTVDLSPWLKSKCHILMKRDDLIHSLISGNKWRKLKYNLGKLSLQNPPVIVTFGGAFSNHIHAVAAACEIIGLSSVGFIRGEIDQNNPTLSFCKTSGMTLIPISRSEYRLKENSKEVRDYLKTLPHFVIIPEGGTNTLALKGVSEVIDELNTDRIYPHHIVLPAGTGGTSAGLLSHPNLTSRILAFSSLKSDHLRHEIESLSNGNNINKLTVNSDFHWGGYAKYNAGLLDFISEFEAHTGISLDHVYNGKAMYGLITLINQNYFKPKETILYLHTGGLQGKAGLSYIQNKQ